MSAASRQLFVTTALPYANGNFHIGHIFEQHRHIGIACDQRVANLVGRLDEANATHNRALFAKIDGLPADIRVRMRQRRDDLTNIGVVRRQLVAINHDIIAAQLAAPARDINHAGNGAKAALQNPILQRL